VSLKDYFKKVKGLGVLSTADKWGRVDSAIYAKPQVLEDGKVAFVMGDRLSYSNLEDNPYAAFLFKEDGAGYVGKRLFLKKVKAPKEEKGSGDKKKNYLVVFKVEKELPLVGVPKKEAHVCPTCHEKVGGAGHLCSPGGNAHENCDWCGSLIPDQRHLCDKKIRALSYICNSCGRTAVKADYLCDPEKVK
jgi:hypothetical protein